MNSKFLDAVTEERDLGMIMQSDLKCSSQCIKARDAPKTPFPDRDQDQDLCIQDRDVQISSRDRDLQNLKLDRNLEKCIICNKPNFTAK